jgi:hypothetical protein
MWIGSTIEVILDVQGVDEDGEGLIRGGGYNGWFAKAMAG